MRAPILRQSHRHPSGMPFYQMPYTFASPANKIPPYRAAFSAMGTRRLILRRFFLIAPCRLLLARTSLPLRLWLGISHIGLTAPDARRFANRAASGVKRLVFALTALFAAGYVSSASTGPQKPSASADCQPPRMRCAICQAIFWANANVPKEFH